MRNDTLTKQFGKYFVTLEFFEEDGEQRAYCDIENTATSASGSLSLAQDMGFLETSHGNEETISDKIVSQIEKWALANDY